MDEDKVQITLRDVYDAVTGLRIEITEMKQEVSGLSAYHAIATDQAKDFEQRLRRLERWAYAIPPTLVLAALSVVATIVTRW